MADQQSVPDTQRTINVRLVAGLLAAVAIALFVAQNTERVQVRFLWFDGSFPLALLLLITVSLTVILVFGATWFLRRRQR